MEYVASNGDSSAHEKAVLLWEPGCPINGDDNRPSQSAEMLSLRYDEASDDQVSVGDSDSRPSNLTCILIVPESWSPFEEWVYPKRRILSCGSSGTVLSDSLIDSLLIDATAEMRS
jgi:hypothetical protein